jgi:biopolymer transport protein TolQ
MFLETSCTTNPNKTATNMNQHMMIYFANNIAEGGTGQKLDLWALVLQSRGAVLFVLILLVLFSLLSWYVIVYKIMVLRRARIETEAFLETFWNSKRLDAIYQASNEKLNSPVAQMFKAGYVELSKLKTQNATQSNSETQLSDLENIERALKRAQNTETTQLERLIPFLATTGSTAPFVGLFGTVWGIMTSFVDIGVKGNASLSTVAPGIAEALIATAIGLVAAIPAVVAYNFFNDRIKVLVSDMEGFSNDFLNIVKRHFLK